MRYRSTAAMYDEGGADRGTTRARGNRSAPGRWGEVFGDETVAAAMIDRLVHHAEVHSFKGDSYRMRGRELGRIPTDHDND